MKRYGKVLLALAAVVWALLLLPFFFGAQGAHPATDDFTFAVYTHPTWVQTGSIAHVIKDACSYALRTWRDWQGTVTGVILMALNPAVFSLEYYGVHAVVLLALCLIGWFVFLRHMLGKRLGLPGRVWGGMYLALSAMLLIFLPDMVEGIYWYNGAWFYMGAQAVALMTLVLCDRFAMAKVRGVKLGLLAALCCVLLLALGMDNYITAMMTAAALAFMALERLWAARHEPDAGFTAQQDGDGWREMTFGGDEARIAQIRAAKRTALLVIPIAAGLLISVLAPGNAVRMAADGAHQSGFAWLLDAAGMTFAAAAGYVVRFMVKTPLLFFLCLATPAICRGLGRCMVRRDYRMPPVFATVIAAYLILCAMIFPHMYASGNAGSGRVVNMYHCYVLTAVPIAWTMILTRVKPDTRAAFCAPMGRMLLVIVAMLALAGCIQGGQVSNYQKLVGDQRDGTQKAYIAQIQNEYALCEAGGEADDVMLPAWTVQTVTGKPTAYEDASMWTNEAMAQYFGVRSVRVQTEEAVKLDEAIEMEGAVETEEAAVTEEAVTEEAVTEAAVAEEAVIEEAATEESAPEEAATEEAAAQ